MKRPKITYKKRNESTNQRSSTSITKEIPSPENPYLAETLLIHGYELSELIDKCSFIEVLLLILTGEFPSKNNVQLIEKLMICLLNPGPRHSAVRAAMNAGVGKTNVSHILPIGLSILSGKYLGADEVMDSMKFLTKHVESPPDIVAQELLVKMPPTYEGDIHIAPGFGSRFNGIDPIPKKTADYLMSINMESHKFLTWCKIFVEAIENNNMGWLSTGIAAAVFCSIGLEPRMGGGLFQIMCAPGILAHGVEKSFSDINAMPFLDNKHYIISDEAKKK